MVQFNVEIQQFLETGRDIYPQPVATACGQILRCRSNEHLLEATLKAAEVLARYIGALALTSYGCRKTDPSSIPFESTRFQKHLAFGDFLELTQSIAISDCDHPLRQQFQAMDSRNKKPPKLERTTSAALGKLLTCRNERGHELKGLNSDQAQSYLAKHEALETLVKALTSAECVLGLPLFLVEEQHRTKGKIMARILLLMGETADPQPNTIELKSDVTFDREPAISFGDCSSTVCPMLLWQAVEETGNTKLFVWDSVGTGKLKYRTLDGLHRELNGSLHARLCSLFDGGKTEVEECALSTGDSLLAWWGRRRKSVKNAGAQLSGWVPWHLADPESLKWYASHLDANADPRKIIQQKLLDGRDTLQPFEIDQFMLLFGKEADVMERLGRQMIDLRVRTSDDKRWDERIESHRNVLQCLRQATDFFRTHVSVGDVTIEGLKETTGTPDYVAMREALVNLFIHQDYADKSACAQIDVAPGIVTFFNPGFSLVDGDKASTGVKSQSRNPLIARTLRLIGFAELAASGLRELQRVWQTAQRLPPKLSSNEKTNSFTLELEWKSLD